MPKGRGDAVASAVVRLTRRPQGTSQTKVPEVAQTMTKPTLYLDVDGALLGHPEPRSGPYQLANHAIEFLDFVLSRFEVEWATTHCRHGDARHLLSYLDEHTPDDLREEVFALAQRVRPTCFQPLKTDIFLASFSPAWIWIDDAPLQAERKILARNGWEDRWLRVDTCRTPDDLLRAQHELSMATYRT